MKDWLKREHGIVLAGGLGFENAYALAMRSQRAQTLGDPHAGRSRAPRGHAFDRRRLRILRPAGMAVDPAGLWPRLPRAADDAAGVHVRGRRGRRGRRDRGLHQRRPHRATQLVVLDDPKHAIPPYDAVLLVSPKRAGDQALLAALAPLVDAIDVAAMREANLRASSGGASVSEAARWLWSEIQRRVLRADERSQSILPRPQPPRLHPDEEPRGARRLEGRGRRPISGLPEIGNLDASR